MKDLVELEVRELLESYGYPDDLPVLKGSARTALEETEPTELGTASVMELMNTVDVYIKQPERLLDASFEVVGSDIKTTTCLGLECLENPWIMLKLVICRYFNTCY